MKVHVFRLLEEWSIAICHCQTRTEDVRVGLRLRKDERRWLKSTRHGFIHQLTLHSRWRRQSGPVRVLYLPSGHLVCEGEAFDSTYDRLIEAVSDWWSMDQGLIKGQQRQLRGQQNTTTNQHCALKSFIVVNVNCISLRDRLNHSLARHSSVMMIG